MIAKLATEIGNLNSFLALTIKTFVDEIQQHQQNGERKLIIRFPRQ